MGNHYNVGRGTSARCWSYAERSHHDDESVGTLPTESIDANPFRALAVEPNHCKPGFTMTIIAHFSIASDAFELGEVLGHDGVRVEVTQFVSMGEALLPYFWVDGTHDKKAFEQQVREDSRVASLTDLDGTVDRTLYHLEWVEGVDGLMRALHRGDLIVERAFGTNEEWQFHLRAHDQEALSAFQETCRDEEIPITVTLVEHNPNEPDETSLRLTQKQHEAVALAFERGYFAVPRESSLTELAEEVGISRQAYSRRLQRGLRHVLEEVLPPESG